MVVFVTTAPAPWVVEPDLLSAGQCVLNISLRDIGPEIIGSSHNIVDDIDHCLTANTSPHLAEQKYGHRDFIDGTLAQLINGDIVLGENKPKIFSPFGLGVLDLAVGRYIHLEARKRGSSTIVPEFFGETERWS
jgi:ornithine cyclodeaminase